jgi:hypothetical protein
VWLAASCGVRVPWYRSACGTRSDMPATQATAQKSATASHDRGYVEKVSNTADYA